MELEQPSQEALRLSALRRCGVLDTDREPQYDDIAGIAARVCGAPYAAITFADTNRCWFKSTFGFDAAECHRDAWYVSQSDQSGGCVAISEPRPQSHIEMDTSLPGFQFFVSAPIFSSDGFTLGSVCVLDTSPREYSHDQLQLLGHLARHVSCLLELKVKTDQLEITTVKVQMLADRDDITGLPSERMFRGQLRTEFQYARRHNQPVSLVLLDIDEFHKLNGEHGIERGDRILKKIARIVNRDTRDYDLVARSGSDEFAIVMRNAASDVALNIAHRLKARVASMEWSGETVTVSAGVATISPDMTGSKDLIDRARRVLTESVSRGRSMIGEPA